MTDTATPFGKAVVEQLLRDATLFEERNAVYKDNYAVVGRVMEALFPDGHTQFSRDDHNRWHLFELVIVKLTRYVQGFDRGGHPDSLKDMRVYLAMLEILDTETEEPIDWGAAKPGRVVPLAEWLLPAGHATIPRFSDLLPEANLIWEAESNDHGGMSVTSMKFLDGEIYKLGDTVYLKQALDNAPPLRIDQFNPSRGGVDGLVVGVNRSAEEDVAWVHPTWISHRPVGLVEQGGRYPYSPTEGGGTE